MRPPLLFVLIVTFFVFSIRSVVADLLGAATPEWMAHEAAVIFEGTPQKVTVYEMTDRGWITEARFLVDRRIKGPVTAGDTITVRSIGPAGETDPLKLADAIPKKRKALVMATIAEHRFPEIDGHYIFKITSFIRPVIFADEPVKYLYTDAGAAIRKYPDVLQRIEEQVGKEAGLAHYYWRGQILKKTTAAGFDTDISKELPGRSACIVDLEYKEP